MERNEILERLNTVFRDVFRDETITVTDSTTASDIEDWESLTHMTLLAAVEEEFEISFNMKDVVKMKNVGNMVDIIQKEV